ncbi:NB-ARC domain-containing disease resistance protein [Prunus dulcis]|uniref:NB-ARC domain-containing disease resistance protein n=1 Tax=Prunus dulcis TaxID=3755 RepID=A0A4Y1QXJ1_PRUDU|nr:NB-ARC domain-containing disease resistance protein [Prunus dulcis]
MNKDDVSVITIVGMGGVGKTTLARMLYNDDRVKEHFTFKAWACVSEDYDAIRVTKTLLESVTSKPCNTTDLNLLQVELREQLRGKKFLFVLDDLWNEKYTDWNCLQTPFTSGARGSKVIITTRNKNIASFMQNVPTQPLEPLSHEDCWSLLAKHAFGNVSCSAYPSLEEIGKKIARKCNGLPLAAQTLGGLISQAENGDNMEEVAKEYFDELLCPIIVSNVKEIKRYYCQIVSFLIELPADLRKLKNLQKLMLGGCASLAKLPVDLWELISLRHLDVSGTKIAEMPAQMSRLKSLRTLTAFVVGESIRSTIGELGELPHLQGKLSILKLQNVVDAKDAVQAI